MSNVTLYEYRGEMLPLRTIADRTGMEYSILYHRMKKYMCSAEEALTIRRRKINARRFMYEGEMRTIMEISEMTGVSAHTISERVKRGVPIEIAATQKHVRLRDLGLDVTPKLSPLERYMRAGSERHVRAKKTCKTFMNSDPRQFHLRQARGKVDVFTFHTDNFLFTIKLIGSRAIVQGMSKNSDYELITRAYEFKDNTIREVQYG